MSTLDTSCEAWAQFKISDNTAVVVRCELTEAEHLAVHMVRQYNDPVSTYPSPPVGAVTVQYSWPGEFTSVPGRGNPRDPKGL